MIGRMIAHPLDILDAKDEMHAGDHRSGLLDHLRHKLAKERRMQAVKILVTNPNFDRLCHVSAGDAIQHLPQLLQHQSRHVSHSTQRPPQHVFWIDGADAAADIFCQIGDALELVCNAEYPYDLPQVESYGLAPSNNLNNVFLNGPLHGVDNGIRDYYLPPAFLVAIGQRPDRLDDLSFDQAAHLRDSDRERLQLGVEYLRRVSKNSHCMTSVRLHERAALGLFCYDDSMTK
jgi:hypothetical protein